MAPLKSMAAAAGAENENQLRRADRAYRDGVDGTWKHAQQTLAEKCREGGADETRAEEIRKRSFAGLYVSHYLAVYAHSAPAEHGGYGG